jgi:hypothetical protein
MYESNEPNHGDKHACWMALKAAYEKYNTSSAIVDSLIGQKQPEDSEGAALRELRTQQRAFEQYFEARMDFLDSCVDQANETGMTKKSSAEILEAESDKKQYQGLAGLRSTIAVPILCGLALTLLCVTALSVILQQRRTHELQSALTELRTRYDQIRETLPPGQTADSKNTAEPSIPHGSELPMGPAASPHHGLTAIQVHKDPSRTGKPRAITTTGVRPPRQGPQKETRGTTPQFRFKLSPSRRFQRVGPIGVAVTIIDPKRKSADLSIVSDSGRFEIRDVRAGRPIRIPIQHGKPLEFVVDHITATALEGHLDTPRDSKPELGANLRDFPWHTGE